MLGEVNSCAGAPSGCIAPVESMYYCQLQLSSTVPPPNCSFSRALVVKAQLLLSYLETQLPLRRAFKA